MDQEQYMFDIIIGAVIWNNFHTYPKARKKHLPRGRNRTPYTKGHLKKNSAMKSNSKQAKLKYDNKTLRGT